MIKCVLFDLDGVLVEACDWHYHALNKALKDAANTEISLDEHMSDFNGLPTNVKLEKLVSLGRIYGSQVDYIWRMKQDFTLDAIREFGKIDHVKIDLMQSLKALGLKIACVTNS